VPAAAGRRPSLSWLKHSNPTRPTCAARTLALPFSRKRKWRCPGGDLSVRRSLRDRAREPTAPAAKASEIGHGRRAATWALDNAGCWDAKRKGAGAQITRLAGRQCNWGGCCIDALLGRCIIPSRVGRQQVLFSLALRFRAERRRKIKYRNKTSQLSSDPGRSDAAANRNSAAAVPFKFGCRSVRVNSLNWPISGSDPINPLANAWSHRQPHHTASRVSSELTTGLGVHS